MTHYPLPIYNKSNTIRDLCTGIRRCMKIQLGICILSALLLNAAHADRTVWYVHPDSTLNSIQAALDSCADNDIVLVGPGTYQELIYWPNTHGIHLTSELGPDVTIIDGNQLEEVVILLETGVDSTTIINGFTIQNGCTGIVCNFASSPIITGNNIQENTPYPWAGGSGIICLDNSAPIITDNYLIDNAALLGGGIYCDHSSPKIINNTISSNGAFFCCGEAGKGGGIYCYHSSPIITGNNIVGNIADWGAGIHCWSSSPTITDNMIVDNMQGEEGDGGGIVCAYGSQPTITSCTITNNELDGVYSFGGASPVIHSCNITDNIGYGINNATDTVVIDAEGNWWGDGSGPYHPTANPGGLGDTVSDYVDFEPWLTNPGVEEYTTSSPLTLYLHFTPNPFTEITEIRYSILDAGYSMQIPTLCIYDASGRLVKSFRPTHYAIRNTLSWNGRDGQNRMCGSGTYFVVLQADEYTATRKILLIR